MNLGENKTQTWSLRVFAILFIVLAIGLFLRIHDLGEENLWTDEAFTAHHANSETFSELIDNVAKTEAAPVGYYVFLHSWVKMFGDSEISLRTPSLIFGILSVLVLFILTRRVFSNSVALVASALMSTSMLQVLYSQEARIYGLFTLLSLISTYLFTEWYSKKSSKPLIVLYILSIALAMYTNYLAIFLIIMYTLFLFFFPPTTKKSTPYLKRWTVAHIVLAILLIPLLGILKTQFILINAGLPNSLLSRGLPAFLAKIGIFFFTLPFLSLLLLFVVLYIFRKKIKKIYLFFLRKRKTTRITFLSILAAFYGAYLYLVMNGLTLFGIKIIPEQIIHSYFLIRHPFFFSAILLCIRSLWNCKAKTESSWKSSTFSYIIRKSFCIRSIL